MTWNSSQKCFSQPQDTTEFAQRFAYCLGVGDVILLKGEIGSGKTHFARSIIQHVLTLPEDVPSPTFTIVQTYQSPKFDIWHCDLYRLTSPDEAFELGLEDAFETALCLIEWPDRLAGDVPNSALTLNFRSGETEHTIQVVNSSPKWQARLEHLFE
jgi:tRNA threonylcarbamoyladenosine biosynthesis protein TsaE